MASEWRGAGAFISKDPQLPHFYLRPWDAIHPGGRFLTPAECSIRQAVKNAQGLKLGEPARRTHGVLSHKDGRAIPVSYLVVQIVVDGLLRGLVMTFYDESERRRLAEELRDRTELLLSTLPVRRADGDGGSPPVENGHALDTPH